MANGAGYRQMKGATLFDSLREEAKTDLGGIDVMRKLLWMVRGSTIRLVSNCEEIEDWDISDAANFNAVEETSDKVNGSTSLELVDVGTTKGTFVTLDEEHRPLNEDWTDFNFLCFWMHDDTGLRLAGELTFQIKNGDVWSAEMPVPVNVTADIFEYKCIEISALAKGNVTGFRFVNQRGTGSSELVYIDTIIVTDIVAGLGSAASVAVGPVMGPIRPYRMDAGSILPGQCASLIRGLVKTAVASDEEVFGVCCAFINAADTIVAADSTPKEVWVASQGAIVLLRNDATGSAAGDPAALASGVITVETMPTTVEKSFAVALDAGTGYEDSYYILGGPYADD